MVVLLLGDGTASLGTEPAAKLANLGITSVVLLRDRDTVGFVLEGWAFDPDRSADTATALLAGDHSEVRTLRPVMHMGVTAAPPEQEPYRSTSKEGMSW